MISLARTDLGNLGSVSLWKKMEKNQADAYEPVSLFTAFSSVYLCEGIWLFYHSWLSGLFSWLLHCFGVSIMIGLISRMLITDYP
jgi:hypothetical protein